MRVRECVRGYVHVRACIRVYVHVRVRAQLKIKKNNTGLKEHVSLTVL